jgi:hypothetical protein
LTFPLSNIISFTNNTVLAKQCQVKIDARGYWGDNDSEVKFFYQEVLLGPISTAWPKTLAIRKHLPLHLESWHDVCYQDDKGRSGTALPALSHLPVQPASCAWDKETELWTDLCGLHPGASIFNVTSGCVS